MLAWHRPDVCALLTSILEQIEKDSFQKARFLSCHVSNVSKSTSIESGMTFFSWSSEVAAEVGDCIDYKKKQRKSKHTHTQKKHKWKSFFYKLFKEEIQGLELVSLNLVGVSLLLAAVDTRNISKAVIMKLENAAGLE